MKITLDTNCFNIRDNPELDQIFDLADKREIFIFFVDALIYEVLSGKIKIEDLPEKKRENARRRLEKAKKYKLIKSWQTFKNHYNTLPMRLGDSEFNEQISDILFPHRKEKNGKYDEEDVRQIVAHFYEKNDIFITFNSRDFINGNRREELQKLGIIVKTPKEFLTDFKGQK